MGIASHYFRFMSACGHDTRRRTWKEELNHQSGRLLGFSSLAGLAWLAYLPSDQILHPDLPVLIPLRILLAVAGLSLPVWKSSRPFWHKPGILLAAMLLVLEIDTGLITGLTGGDPPYLGGYIFIISLIPLAPLSLPVSLGSMGLGLGTFLVTALLQGFDIADPVSAYGMADLLFACLLSSVFTILMNQLRKNGWRQYLLLTEQKTRIDMDREVMGNLLRSILPGHTEIDDSLRNKVRPTSFPDVTLVRLEVAGHPRNGLSMPPVLLDHCMQEMTHALEEMGKREGLTPLDRRGGTVHMLCGAPDYVPGHGMRALMAVLRMGELIRLRNEFPHLAPPREDDLSGASPVWHVRCAVVRGPLSATHLPDGSFLYEIRSPLAFQAARLGAAASSHDILFAGPLAEEAAEFFRTEARGTLEGDAPIQVHCLLGLRPDRADSPECRNPGEGFFSTFQSIFGVKY